MVLKADKSHFLTVGFNEQFLDFSFNDTTIENATEEKILGLVIDNRLNFKSLLKNICKKVNQKLSALSRTSKLTALNQWEKMVNFFIDSQFSYCPLIRMFISKGCNKKIYRIHKRLLRLILNDDESSFYDMLSTLNEKTIYKRCINVL